MRTTIAPNERKLIVNAVCDVYGLRPRDLKGRRRYEPLAEARHVAMTILRRRGHTVQAVAEVFDRDHAVTLHAVRRIDALRETDLKFRKRWAAVKSAIDASEIEPANRVRLSCTVLVPNADDLDDEQLFAAAIAKARIAPEKVKLNRG